MYFDFLETTVKREAVIYEYLFKSNFTSLKRFVYVLYQFFSSNKYIQCRVRASWLNQDGGWGVCLEQLLTDFSDQIVLNTTRCQNSLGSWYMSEHIVVKVFIMAYLSQLSNHKSISYLFELWAGKPLNWQSNLGGNQVHFFHHMKKPYICVCRINTATKLRLNTIK